MKILLILGLIILCWLTSLAVLKTQISRYDKYWLDVNKQSSESSKLYIALGDSAAQGIGASKPQNGYVGLIAEKLNQNGQYSVINLSKSGARLKDVLDVQLPKLDELNIGADTIITLEIGANDLADYDEVRFRNLYEEILQKLPKQAVVSDIPYFGAGIFRSRENYAVSATKIIHELAKSSGHKVARLHDYTLKNNSLSYFAADYFHPNNKAYENWFRAFEEQLTD